MRVQRRHDSDAKLVTCGASCCRPMGSLHSLDSSTSRSQAGYATVRWIQRRSCGWSLPVELSAMNMYSIIE
ncbi:hypothetical protein DOTSEDRAFT_68215 [Dothistroma septosporum NZE10]|uniref:Uncharacterized protein n=1 Tax=Dothistroma septosporum (strain NZE10 / CBS 128990) TaxID=675120 RepID=N1Q3U8_DOTSN|nr:hypothetical protein DOTSEDRAFT_68215 [Dothistroma septosporum NZE10]